MLNIPDAFVCVYVWAQYLFTFYSGWTHQALYCGRQNTLDLVWLSDVTDVLANICSGKMNSLSRHLCNQHVADGCLN